ncbi:hypothetical protein RLON56S_01300 [Alishewanella longhuensis]
MAYQPRLPKTNPNIGRQRPLQDLLLIGSALLALLFLLYWLLGLAIDKAINQLSPELEQQWFANFASKPEPSPQQAYLQQLTQDLQKCSTVPYPVNVHFIDKAIANAGVMPGGTMLVYRGLLEKLDSENALAFILAHELAHLQHRDHLRGFGRALVLAVITSTLTGSSGAGQIFLPATEFGMAQHSQQRELAADAAALTMLNCHYGHTGAAEVFFHAMLQLDTSKLPSWFDSHPKLQLRLNAIQQQRQQQGYSLGTLTPLPAALMPK